MAHQFLETMKIDSFIFAPVVQSALTAQATGPDLDQLAGQLSQGDSSDAGVQTFSMGGS